MEKRRFGKTDMDVSVLGFGGAEIGFDGASQKAVIELLAGALDAGLNVIDTAECYVNSEEMIGVAVSGRRSDFYLFTKCGHKGSYDVDAWSKEEISASIDQSLKRLKTDYVDLVQLHSCSLEHLKQGEVIEALQKAKAEGKTRYIGYSGDSDAAIFACQTGAFDTLQTSVSIADQESIERVLPVARQHGMGVIAKRPVANSVWKHKTNPGGYAATYWDRLAELKYDFINGNQGDIAAEVIHALKFTLAQQVHTAIVGTSKPSRWQENARALDSGPISGVEIEKIQARWKEVARPDWVGQV